jgi:hypothetical protein
MADLVKQTQANNAAYAACDTFRGVIDRSQLQRLHPRDAFPKIHLGCMEIAVPEGRASACFLQILEFAYLLCTTPSRG